MTKIAASYDFWAAVDRHWREMFVFFAGLPALTATDEPSLWWPDAPGGTQVRHTAPLSAVLEQAHRDRDIKTLRSLVLVGLSMINPTQQQRETISWQLVQDLICDDWIVTPNGQIVGRRRAM